MSLYGSLGVTVDGRGKKITFGTVTPTSASHEVVTGLSEVDEVFVSMQGAPTLTHFWTSGVPSGTAGNITILTQKPTSSSNLTPIDATTPWTAVDWVAIGT